MQKVLDKLKERLERGDYVPSYTMALMYTGLGDKDQAFEWLEKARKDRSEELTLLKVDPKFDILRADPRFSALQAKMGFE